jgi:hypothetical protein
VNWDALPIDRDPTKAVDAYPRGSWAKWDKWDDGYKGYHGGYQRTLADNVTDAEWSNPFAHKPASEKIDKTKAPTVNGKTTTTGKDALADMQGLRPVDIEWMCSENSEDAALAIVELLRQNAKLRADVATMTTLLGL